MDKTHNILLLDADEQSAQDIQRFLKVSAYTFGVSHASDISEGLNYLKNRKPDIILVDAAVAGQKDFPVFKQVASNDNIPLILLSDLDRTETQRRAEMAGAVDFMVKNKINLFHLQKIILNNLRISETKSQLNTTVDHFNTQQEALFKLLDKTSSGVLILNAKNEILYANAKAYNILGEESTRRQLADYIKYQDIDEEELIELKPKNKPSVSIKVSPIEWNEQTANLFVLEKIPAPFEKTELLIQDTTFQALLNSVEDNVMLMKGERVVLVNKPALAVLRLKQSDVIDRSLRDIFESKQSLVDGISVRSILEERSATGFIKTPDGSLQKAELKLKPINIGNEFYQLLSFHVPAGQAEKNVPSSSSDEGKFSTHNVLHLASHDLREPVRTILNYIQLASDNIKNQKYEIAGEYTEYARSAADRMERLLTDLKTYIALNDYNFTLTKVSMKVVLADVLKQLKTKIDETGAEINVAELPEVNADRELVEKLLLHLVDNALKFHKKGKKPVIDIGFDKFEGNVLFCVRDNGLGVSKRYQDKIFNLFERLNRVDEYPGNGLGLAICKKIIEMHGGRIWVESLPGFGSSFYFILSSK